MEILRTIATLLPLAVSSGINLYATILIAGLCIRFNWVQNVPPGLEVLAAWPVIIAAGIFYAMEFLATKIQFVDNLWDIIHTVIRPLGAAMLGVAAIGEVDPVLVVLAGLVMGSIALASHAGKAGSRVALNVMSPAENASNTGLSIGEDLLAGLLTVLALTQPLVAGAIALVVLVLMALLVPRFLSWAFLMVRAVAAWVRASFNRALNRPETPDTLPPLHAAQIGGLETDLVAACKAQSIRGANGRPGFLSLPDHTLAFTYDTSTGSEAWQMELDRLVETRLYRRPLVDVLEVRHLDERGKERKARFVFMKDRTHLAEAFAARLAGAELKQRPQRLLGHVDAA